MLPTDKDLREFTIYAFRERSLDASLRSANAYGWPDDTKKSIAALRDLNLKMLINETRRGIA